MINSQDQKLKSPSLQFQFAPAEEVRNEPLFNDYGEEIFAAGQIVSPGTYIEEGGSRKVTLERPGILPASLNGRRSYYCRYDRPWITSPAAPGLSKNN